MTRLILIAAVLALAVTLPSFTANAQGAIRTYVSTTGSNSNPCSLTSPCRDFSAAVAVTALGGEVDALDPGGYGSFTISQAITINGQGWSYVAPPAGEPAITITATSGNITITGVSINGVGAAGETTGINFTGAGTLTINDSVIQNFKNNGLNFVPTAASQLFVSNTMFANNANQGAIVIIPQTGANVTGSIDHVHESGSTDGFSVAVFSGNTTINVTVSDSLFADNGFQGIQCQGPNAANQVQCLIQNTTVANNGGIGISGTNSATIWVTRSSIFGNATGVETGGGSLIISYGDNNLVNNTTEGSFTSTLTYK